MRFAELANRVARGSGRSYVFAIALISIIAWLATGPLFGFSDAWQLIVNTATNVVTFLMVFLIQNTQNRDTAALQAKLDELIRASGARQAYIGIEQLTEQQIQHIRGSMQPSTESDGKAVRIHSPALDVNSSALAPASRDQ